MNDTKEHWDKVYTKTKIEYTGWYEESPMQSLSLIEKCGLNSEAKIIDIGSGASTLIPELILRGYKNIIASDISDIALRKAKTRLNPEQSVNVKWIEDDVTKPVRLLNIGKIDLWHDRTVLHFLTEERQRHGYLSTLKSLVKTGGFVIIAVFAIGGATKCSGLDVVNYSAQMIAEFLGEGFELHESFDYLYIQPSGGERPFVYTLFQRICRKYVRALIFKQTDYLIPLLQY